MRPPPPVPWSVASSSSPIPCSSARVRTAGDRRPWASSPPFRGGGGTLPCPCPRGKSRDPDDSGSLEGGDEMDGSLEGGDCLAGGGGTLPWRSLTGGEGLGAALDTVAGTLSSITQISVPTVTVAPSSTLISLSTPATGAGTSALTLSVMTSTRLSYFFTGSPTFFSQRAMVPSVMDSPSWGMVTTVISTSPARAPWPGSSPGWA